MHSWRAILILAGAGVAACAIDLDASGAGKACTSDRRCAGGFVCNAEGRCVESSGGSGGNGGNGGSAGRPATWSIPDAAPDIVPEPGDRDAAHETGDAPDATSGDTGCTTPTEYFADGDGDGFGEDGVPRRACSPPAGAWVPVAGDCDDGNADVFPAQTRFFGAPHSGPNGDSFDYDCSGGEDPDPDGPAHAPDCAALGVLDCKGGGYVATKRTGEGVNPICGSARKAECQPALLVCAALEADVEPARCH